MPKKDGIGFGEFTELKIKNLGKIFNMHLAITQAVLRKNHSYQQSYRYIDVTAGKGYVPESTLLGSPLVFLESSNSPDLNMSFNVDLFERVEENYNELVKSLNNCSQQSGWNSSNSVTFHNSEYQNSLSKLLPYKNSKELGLLFVDHSGDLPNFDAIRHVAEMRPRMEILIYIPARTIKRLHHLTGKSLLDYMEEIGKKTSSNGFCGFS